MKKPRRIVLGRGRISLTWGKDREDEKYSLIGIWAPGATRKKFPDAIANLYFAGKKVRLIAELIEPRRKK